MEPKQYISIHLNLDYDKQTLVCLMGDYATNALQELEHLTPKQHFHGPAPYIQPNYKQTVQYAQHDTTPLLPLRLTKFIQCTTKKN